MNKREQGRPAGDARRDVVSGAGAVFVVDSVEEQAGRVEQELVC